MARRNITPTKRWGIWFNELKYCVCWELYGDGVTFSRLRVLAFEWELWMASRISSFWKLFSVKSFTKRPSVKSSDINKKLKTRFLPKVKAFMETQGFFVKNQNEILRGHKTHLVTSLRQRQLSCFNDSLTALRASKGILRKWSLKSSKRGSKPLK